MQLTQKFLSSKTEFYGAFRSNGERSREKIESWLSGYLDGVKGGSATKCEDDKTISNLRRNVQKINDEIREGQGSINQSTLPK